MKPPATVRLDFQPYPHQRDAHRKRKRFTVLVWHRRAGKTVFAIVELILAALVLARPRGRYAYIAPQLKQAKQAAWDYLRHYARAIPGVVVNEGELSVTFPNGAQIRVFGADNPDSLRGTYFDGLVLDEVAQMKPMVWDEVVRPALADREGWCIFLGTPKGVNLFSKTYFDALKPENADRWHADLRRWNDTNVLKVSEIEDARRGMSPQLFAQEFECDFHAAVTNAMVPLSVVLEAGKRAVVEREVTPYPRVMGVDVARFGDDSNAIARRQGPALMPLSRFRGLDLMSVASRVAMVATEWQPEVIFVDVGGVGGGPVDRLRQLGWNVIEVNFGGKASDERYQNKRAEIWARMAEWMKTGSIPGDDHTLIAELTAPTYDFANVNGKVQLESKDEMRKRGLPSPDGADSVACTFAELLPPRGLFGDHNLRASAQVETDFDPWAALRGGN